MRLLKDLGKSIVVSLLGWQLKRLLAKNPVKVIGVAGSYGKTSSKIAIATVLSKHYRVQYQNGNYNDIVTVPLIFFGQTMPSLLNPIGWAKVLLKNEQSIRKPYPYDVVVVEVGTDFPGQIAAFKRYLKLDMAVVTAIAYEHMEHFTDLDAVASEELSLQQYTNKLIYNADLCNPSLLGSLTSPAKTFSIATPNTDYTVRNPQLISATYNFDIARLELPLLALQITGFSRAQLYSACAAVAVATELKVPDTTIQDGCAAIEPVSGRLQLLKGTNNCTILDDSYNSSPSAAIAALDVLHGLAAPQKIALLGDMNELGDYSEDAHTDLGKYCDPTKLDLVVTLGPFANKYTAAEAQKNGCRVITCTSPYQAGDVLKQNIQDGAVILVKGSQNNVYAEEAIKPVLAKISDEARLVRQSPAWLAKKAKSFNDVG